VPVPGEPGTHFGGSTAPIPFFGQNGYIALTAFVINVIIAVVLTLIFRAARVPAGADETQAPHYTADAGEPAVKELPELVEDTR
jgi:solute:Na+ symporter, SSS family